VAFLRFVLGLGLATVVALVGGHLVPGFAGYADPFLVVAVLAATAVGPLGALAAGSAAGWVADALGGGPFGLFGFTHGAVGYAVALVAQRIVVDRKSSLAGILAAAGAAQGALLAAVGVLLVGPAGVPSVVELAARVGSTVVLGGAWLFASRTVVGRWRKRRRKSGGIVLPKSLLR